MHSPVERSSGISLDDACDRVLDAFIDGFSRVDEDAVPNDRWLARLIQELEDARADLQEHLRRVDDGRYKRNLARCIKRVENVLAQLYEEQLHH